MEATDLVPLFGLILAGLLINVFSRDNTLIIAMFAGAAIMAFLNRNEVDPADIIERTTQGAGIILMLYVITRIPALFMRVFKISNFVD